MNIARKVALLPRICTVWSTSAVVVYLSLPTSARSNPPSKALLFQLTTEVTSPAALLASALPSPAPGWLAVMPCRLCHRRLANISRAEPERAPVFRELARKTPVQEAQELQPPAAGHPRQLVQAAAPPSPPLAAGPQTSSSVLWYAASWSWFLLSWARLCCKGYMNTWERANKNNSNQ